MPTSCYEQGDPNSKICIVAEAPAATEMREGRPLCGPSGELFERTLHAAGIARAECYITNIFEQPVRRPKDEGSKLYDDSNQLLWTATKGFTEAGKAATANSLARIRACGSNVLVSLGGPALSLLVDNRSPLKWRGSIIAGIDGRKVVATIHPSFCLRGAYESRYLLISDLKKAKAQSASPEIVLPKRDLIVDPSYDQCIDALNACLHPLLPEHNAVATDIELLNGQVDCFSLALTPQQAICIPIIDAGFEHRWTPEQEAEIWRLYAAILGDPTITKVNQNITFDLAVLLQLNNIVPAGPLHDPMIAHSVMYPMLKKDLGTLCSMYTDEPYYKDQGSLEDSYKVEDFARRWAYNARDAACALECWQHLSPVLDAEGYRSTYDMTIALIPSLLYMMVNGIKVDHEALVATKIKAQADLAALTERLAQAIGRPVITEAPKTAKAKREAAGSLNLNSPAQWMKHFYDDLKLKPYVNQAGARSIDDRALSRIIRRDGLPEARLLQEYRGLAKMISTYLEVSYDADGRIRSSYNPRGTWTGRLSSSQTVFGGGFNAQNLPDEMRAFMVAD